MREPLKSVSEIVAKANDIFFERHQWINTVIGIMDKTLRNQGMATDAITIDCVAQDKKMVLLLHDKTPTTINVALGNKAGEVFSSIELAIDKLSVEQVVGLLEMNFVKVKKH